MIRIDTAEGFVWINRSHVVSVTEHGPLLKIIVVDNRTYYDSSFAIDDFVQKPEGHYL